jgi:hypothetical protein
MPNPKRQRLPVPWGDGIERRSGAMVTDAGAFRDLRNVRLSDGRTELRRGHSRLLLLPIGTALLGVFSIRAQGLAAIISYDAVTRTVSLWVVDATGSAAAFVGNLYVLPPDTPSPPMISAAASYDKLVIAHDEPIYRFRRINSSATIARPSPCSRSIPSTACSPRACTSLSRASASSGHSAARASWARQARKT